MNSDVLIMGDLAGLSCAKTLENDGRAFMLLEATETVGGRIRTDHADGFLRPEDFKSFLQRTQRPGRYWITALKLHHFLPGAVRAYCIFDPIDAPNHNDYRR